MTAMYVPPLTSSESGAPYRLRSILFAHRLQQTDLCRRIVYAEGPRAGQPISKTTLSTLITRRQWPQQIPRPEIEAAVAKFLADAGVPPEEAVTAWTVDGNADAPIAPCRDRSHRPPKVDEDAIDIPEPDMLSHAARQHFGLARHPFVDDVQGPTDVYLSKEQRYIRESMYYAARHGGLVAVIGESGSGKSTLRRDLVDRIGRGTEQIVVIQPQTIDKTALTAAHICDAIVADLSDERPKLSLEAKGRQVQRILAASARAGNAHALLIEEAHDLSTSTLKYLKRFWELEDGFKRLLGIVLVGQPELGQRLDERRNPDLREFIRRCEVAVLRPLNGNLEEYLALKFRRIDVALDAVFERDAFDAIRKRLTRVRPNGGEVESQLYPLVVQNVVVKAMNAAVDLGLPKIDAQLIGRV